MKRSKNNFLVFQYLQYTVQCTLYSKCGIFTNIFKILPKQFQRHVFEKLPTNR